MLALWEKSYTAWTVSEWAVAIVIVAAVLGVVGVALRAFEIVVPEWVKKILLIILVAVVAVLAIRLVASL